MAENNHSPYLQQLKKRIYLHITPIVIFALLLGWFFRGSSPDQDHAPYFIFPILSAWLFLVMIAIWKKDQYIYLIERISFISITIIYLYWFSSLIFHEAEKEFLNGGLGPSTNWFPLFFIFIYLIFNRKNALIYSIAIFSFTLIIGFSTFSMQDGPAKIRALDILMQFYLSNAALIFALFYIQQLKEEFIQKEMLSQLADQDYLTSIPNRRMLEKMVHDSCTVGNRIFSVILFDIDHFKKINDQYGHDVGDEVLKEYTNLVKMNIRDTDVFGRWGGEEFLLIAYNQNLRQAALVAERLRKTFEDHHFKNTNGVTSSFGVAEFKQQQTMKNLIKSADLALYKAKEQGRNQVCTYKY